MVREFGDTVEFGVALNLDADENEIANGKVGPGATGVDAVTMSLATIGNNESHDFLCKVDMSGGLRDVSKNRGAGVG